MEKSDLENCSVSLRIILGYIEDEKYAELNLLYYSESLVLKKQLRTLLSFQSTFREDGDFFQLFPFLLKSTIVKWKRFDEKFTGVITSSIQEGYKQLFHETKYVINSLMEYITSTNSFAHGEVTKNNVRIKNPEDEQSRLDELNRHRTEIKAQYNQALNETPLDTEKVNKIKKILDTLDAEFLETRRTLDMLKTDSANEKYMRDRIALAMNNICVDSHLEDELKKLRFECNVFTFLICILVFSFSIGYGCFIANLHKLSLYEWCDYLPYTLSVPIVAGFLWLFVYLKNRASKLAIEISSKLYNIKYLEGLMQMTVSISKTNEDSLTRIDMIVKSMVDSFLKIITKSVETSEEISSIEKKELKDNPYWQVLNELKEYAKLIRHE